jgi:uncharacterized Zn-binding protein involved in type VI secretion
MTIDEIGKTYGLLTVLEHVGKAPNGRAAFLCVCACGKTRVTTGRRLRQGDAFACTHKGHRNGEINNK